MAPFGVFYAFCLCLHVLWPLLRMTTETALEQISFCERSEGFRYHFEHDTHLGKVYPDRWLNEAIFHNRTQGFYIEIGVLCPTTCSTGTFFDLELCWSGFCIDGQFASHKATESSVRTCNSLHGIVCSSGKTSDVFIEVSGGGQGYSGIESSIRREHLELITTKEHSGEWQVSRKTLHCVDIMAEVRNSGRHKIDLLLIDVEGAEIELLTRDDLFEIPIHTIVVETDQPDRVEYLLTGRNYTKVGQVGYDYVFKAL